jgi:hypothetical protein
LQPTDVDKKTGDLVETVLRSKHPDARIPKPESLPHYAHTPGFVEVNITADDVEKVARLLVFVDDGCFLCFCCSFCCVSFVFVVVLLQLSLVMFLSSVLAEGALECDHNL